ncbi:hypothetical protein [Rivularia sp. UHCC 0363]|uniref:hypothetical protein n=1 Tax=Rivularia sp. UHCC 0363 TaxID=3110244 RepID=UPI002B20C390|nr:hypothetical protein [Rivularia sp. UHCC 0363]MEA5593843.1 hypothetical protein [Rivularia sp. UHCC 0363]
MSPYGSSILGAASPYSFQSNFTGATKDNTYYAASLANHLAGEDLNGDRAEIDAYFNSSFSKWYFGTDGNTPTGKYDFTTVVLHELGHGFGLTDFIYYNNGTGSYGSTIFESFVVNGNNQSLNTFTNNSKELGTQLISNNLFFNGANATAANGGLNPKLYAPTSWEYGSSVAHFDEKTYPKGNLDSLMTPYFASAEAIHNPGAMTLGVLQDLGWDINQVNPAPIIETISTPLVAEIKSTPAISTIPTILFNSLESYAGQDKNPILNISADGKEFEVQGNSWKKLSHNYNITADTILEFEFQSTVKGEIQGIGFETDDKLTNTDAKRLFQLSGTQKGWGISDFEYQTNSGWQSYQIRVGDYFTGEFNYLTFANDHDVSNADAQSQFRNLRLYEYGQAIEIPTPSVVETPPIIQLSIINVEESELTSYASQDKNSSFTISENKQQIEIQGNAWKKLSLDYKVTQKTILEFEFQSDIRGEIQGIGFDTNDNFNNKDDNPRLFQLEGTQKLGVSDFKEDITGLGWKTYQIEVGEYFTGDINYLTFVNDHDVSRPDAASKYRNIKIYESNTNKISTVKNQEFNSDLTLFVKDSTNNYSLSSYGGIAQDRGIFSISDDKTEIELQGNSWKKLDINNYNITENTRLKFEFQSLAQGEIQGIGFDSDDIINNSDRANLFQVSGTQNWGVEIEDNYTLGSGWKTYEVKVGDYIRGEFDYLTLANDDDANSTAQSQFRNISLYEM